MQNLLQRINTRTYLSFENLPINSIYVLSQKLRTVTKNQGGKEYLTSNKRNEGRKEG